MGVGAALGVDERAAGRDGERHLEGDTAGQLLVSSSQVEVVISSSRHRLSRVARAGSVWGGNSTVKYCWMMGLSFFLL